MVKEGDSRGDNTVLEAEAQIIQLMGREGDSSADSMLHGGRGHAVAACE